MRGLPEEKTDAHSKKGKSGLYRGSEKRREEDGIKVTVDKDIMAFSGEKSLFIADQEAIYCCDADYTECLTVFMEYMVMGLDAENEVSVNDRVCRSFTSVF